MGMAQNSGFASKRQLIPDDAAGSLIHGEYPELLFGRVIAVITFASQLRFEYHLRIRAYGRRQKNKIVPDDGARQSESRNRRLPRDILFGLNVPGDRQISVRGHASGAVPAEARPILAVHRDKNKQKKQKAHTPSCHDTAEALVLTNGFSLVFWGARRTSGRCQGCQEGFIENKGNKGKIR
jgi:hypothetical protein